MKSLLYLILLISFQANSFSHEKGKSLPAYQIKSDTINESFAENEALFTIKIPEHLRGISKHILYSINETEKKVRLGEKLSFEESVRPGKYIFQFLLNEKHLEIFTDSIEIKSKHHITMVLNFRSAKQNIYVKKPVIYLYPKEETDVTIELNVVGKLSFSYPSYTDGWNVQASPNGDLTIKDEVYNYLFWESEYEFSEELIDRNKGFLITADKLESFLEKTLTDFGFTSKERADFITYWIPNMQDATNLYIYFLFNKQCDAFATLNISPKPNEIARFYMLWESVNTDYDEIGIIPQEIPSMDRSGFTVLEWGGAEIGAKNELVEQ